MLSKQGTIGLVVLSISLVLLGLSPTQQRRPSLLGSQFKLVFHSCQGLREGDLVKVGGVEAGRVINIDFAPESDWTRLNPPGVTRPVVLVSVTLNQGFHLSRGSGYKVVSNLRGSHFINILPAPPGERLAPGTLLSDELEGEADDQLMATIRGFKVLSQRTKDLRQRFGEPGYRRDLKDLASNLRFYSHEFLRVSRGAHSQMQAVTRNLEQQENSLLANLQSMDQRTAQAAGYFKGLIPSLSQQVVGYRQRLKDSQKQLDQLYASARGGAAQFAQLQQRLAHSPLVRLDREKLSQSVHDLKNKVEFYADIAQDIHTYSSLPQTQKELKAIPKKYKVQSERWRQQTQELETQVDRFRWLPPKVEEDSP